MTAGDLILTVAAILGTLCIAATLAAVAAGISLVLFSTGSMTPTIPAGSVAIVRVVPADEIAVGDVVTVERPGRLPVTHRVRAIEVAPDRQRVLTLRGDANATDDTETYRVGSVRIVLASVPGLAPLIAGFGSPLVLGSLTLGAALLVLWAFWPRPPSDPGSPRGGAPRRALPDAPRRVSRAVAALTVALGVAVVAAVPAGAAPVERVIRGRVITLTTVGDEEAMTSLAPGQPVSWQVGVTSDPPEPGQIELSIRASGPLAATESGLQVRLDSCPQRWLHERCAAGATAVLADQPAVGLVGASVPVGKLRAGDERWLQVTAWLPASGPSSPGDTSTVTIAAVGWGDVVDTGPRPDLPQTGPSASRPMLWLGAGALALGCALLLLRRRSRR